MKHILNRSFRLNERFVLSLKILSLSMGAVITILCAFILTGSIYTFSLGGKLTLIEGVEIFSSLSTLIAGVALISIFIRASKMAFVKPVSKKISKPVYGFSTLLALGIGSTIGSPLFIILPVNIVQFAYVSIISLAIPAVLSFLLAKLYSSMINFSYHHDIESVGGPTFVKTATGDKSARYFITRFSLWIANTSLAAFSALYFVTFSFVTFPRILEGLGLSALSIYGLESVVIGLFALWFVINAFYEHKYLRIIGYSQIMMVIIMVVLVIFQGVWLGDAGHWNFTGLFSYSSGNVGFDILENTGYLFILFFGFQEIAIMTRETVSESKIPIVSFFLRGKKYSKQQYITFAMIATVFIATAVMLFDALTVFTLHAPYSVINKVSIPSLYLVGHYVGKRYEIPILIAFLLATVTTFVPALIAGSRHLRTLSEDGFFPTSLRNLSWIFTLALIVILALAGASFLVNITDFMVLIAMGMISLAPFWIKRKDPSITKKVRWISLIVGLSFFFVDITLYPQNQTVVLFGVVAVLISFMIYDLLSITTLGFRLFVILFSIVSLLALALFPYTGTLKYPIMLPAVMGFLSSPVPLIPVLLFIGIALVFMNIVVDKFAPEKVAIMGQM